MAIVWKERLKLNLLIYQLEDYLLARWWWWYIKGGFKKQKGIRKQLIWTQRVKALTGLGLFFWSGVTLWVLLTRGLEIALGVMILVALLPELVMVLGSLILWPIVWVTEERKRNRVKRWFREQPKLTVVGVTGSYGKTSVKEMVFEIMDRVGMTAMTPENFNTLAGLDRVIRAELTSRYKYLVAEMGAYQPGDICRLAEITKPKWGIITAVGPQHLERFGSIENIAKTKLELGESVGPEHLIVNWDNQDIRERVTELGFEKKVIKVGEREDTDYTIENCHYTKTGLTFRIRSQNQLYDFQSRLFGKVNAINFALAIALALELKISKAVILRAVLHFPPLPHRLALFTLGRAMIIDNTYSSNADGFRALINEMKDQKGRKALVTPGLVELGEAAIPYQKALGKPAAGVFEEVILVGNNKNTQALARGLAEGGFSGKLKFIGNNPKTYWQEINRLAATCEWVALENDVPDQYI